MAGRQIPFTGKDTLAEPVYLVDASSGSAYVGNHGAP